MAMYESITLKNCPFCGGKPDVHLGAYLDGNKLLTSMYADKIGIHCTKCRIATPMGELDEIVSVWNKRADTTSREICEFLRCKDTDELEVTFQKTITGERTVTITKWEG